MKKLIIVEAPNNSGKTTLCKKLEAAGYFYIKFNQPSDDPFKDYLDAVKSFMSDTEHDKFVTDRFHLGECVYPKLKNRPSNFTQRLFITLEDFIKKNFDSLLVLCDIPVNKIKEFNIQNKEDFVTNDQVEQEVQLFRDAFYNSKISKGRYSFLQPGSGKFINEFTDKWIV